MVFTRNPRAGRREAFALWLTVAAGATVVALLLGCSALPVAHAAASRIEVIKTPDGGIQPQAVADAKGTLHLIYYKGDPTAGDLFYVRRERGSAGFSAPIRVNSQPGSAIAMGTIRGGQIALGRNGRVHVVWNGSGQESMHVHPEGAPPAGITHHPGGHTSNHSPGGGAPLLYTRLNDAGTAFEPQRNLIRATYNLDGGGTVAADGAGNVYAAWHAAPSPGAGEENRRVWVARSADDGRTFSAEAPASVAPTGACGCCGAKAFGGRDGTLYILYRAATQRVERGMQLLTSRDHGRTFQARALDRWNVDT